MRSPETTRRSCVAKQTPAQWVNPGTGGGILHRCAATGKTRLVGSWNAEQAFISDKWHQPDASSCPPPSHMYHWTQFQRGLLHSFSKLTQKEFKKSFDFHHRLEKDHFKKEIKQSKCYVCRKVYLFSTQPRWENLEGLSRREYLFCY